MRQFSSKKSNAFEARRPNWVLRAACASDVKRLPTRTFVKYVDCAGVAQFSVAARGSVFALDPVDPLTPAEAAVFCLVAPLPRSVPPVTAGVLMMFLITTDRRNAANRIASQFQAFVNQGRRTTSRRDRAAASLAEARR
jgi:hypothetical protein